MGISEKPLLSISHLHGRTIRRIMEHIQRDSEGASVFSMHFRFLSSSLTEGKNIILCSSNKQETLKYCESYLAAGGRILEESCCVEIIRTLIKSLDRVKLTFINP